MSHIDGLLQGLNGEISKVFASAAEAEKSRKAVLKATEAAVANVSGVPA